MNFSDLFIKSATNQAKMKLQGSPWETDSWERPELEVGIFANNPRLTVWLRDKAEGERNGENGKPLAQTPISAAMNPRIFRRFITMFREAVVAGEPRTIQLTTKGPGKKDDGGKDYANLVSLTKVRFGVTADGVSFLEIRTKARRAAMFEFAGDRYAEFSINDEPADKVDSRDEALAWIDIVSELTVLSLANDFIQEAEIKAVFEGTSGTAPKTSTLAAASSATDDF